VNSKTKIQHPVMTNRALPFTADRLLHILRSLPVVNTYIVGFSGGADSTALLHALSTIQDQLDAPVSAVHVNHGLHDDADLWQSECENFCAQHRIKLVCLRIRLENRSGKGLEAEARHLRYEAISALLKAGDCLLTAHHADDQAETLLLNLMRGSGVDGLSAMPESRPLGHGVLQRPLLRFQNNTLRDYLRSNNIEWSEDPSNQHLDHDRNFVRHEIIPLLEKRWPEVSKRLLLTHRAMTDARVLLERLADEYLGKNLAHPFVMRITAQLFADPELFKLVIRRWIKQSGSPSMPVYRLESFCEQLRQAHNDHKTTVAWGGCLLRLYKQQLWLQTDREILACPTRKWAPGHKELDLGRDVGQLVLNGEIYPNGEFSIGARSNMEETVISKGGHHKSLKNLFQSAGIPPWLRDCIPLCKLDGELVAMGDWCLSSQFAAWLSENNLKLSWRPRNPLLQFILAQQHSRGT
jgi:tRNA(Ile)-lysidine synthase